MTGSQAPDSGKPIAGEPATCECHVCDKPCTEDDFTFWCDGEIVYQCADCSQTLRRAFEQQVRFAAKFARDTE
jgi:hypothetical protein